MPPQPQQRRQRIADLRLQALERYGGIPMPPQPQQRRQRIADLRLQALEAPARAVATVHEPVVQSAGLALPEFETLRREHVAAPLVGQWHFLAAELPLVLRQA